MNKLDIKVTHIGEDYGIISVIDDDGVVEYEVPKGLAEAYQVIEEQA